MTASLPAPRWGAGLPVARWCAEADADLRVADRWAGARGPYDVLAVGACG